MVTGVKSRCGSYGTFLKNSGLVTSVASVAASSVWPSAGAFATVSAATKPEAPGLLSITTGWPRDSGSFAASGRLMMSFDPPAGEGTTTRIGRVGKFCPRPVEGPAAQASRNSRTSARFMSVRPHAEQPGMREQQQRVQRETGADAPCADLVEAQPVASPQYRREGHVG